MTWSWRPKWIVSRMRHDVEQACVFHRTDHVLAEVPYDLNACRWSPVLSNHHCVITCGLKGKMLHSGIPPRFLLSSGESWRAVC